MKNFRFLLFTLWAVFSMQAVFAGLVEVAAGGDIRAALREASAIDTVLLRAGEYTLTTQIEQDKDIVLMGAPGEMPVVNFTNFVLGTQARKLVLDGLHVIYNRKYLVYNASEKEVDIDRIILRNCILNLNGENGASLILNRSTAVTNRMDAILIENCIVYNAQAPAHGVVNIGKESTVQVASITLKNSTFVDFARGVILVPTTMNDLKIKVENCTFYQVNTTENSAAIFHANLGNTHVDITRCFFCIPGASPKFIDVGSGGATSVEDSYRVGVQPRVRNPYGLQTVGSDAKKVFASPDNDPLHGCTSYRLLVSSLVEKGVGDPRWK